MRQNQGNYRLPRQVPLYVTLWTTVTRLLCPWDSPRRNTGVSYHFFLQGSSRPRDWTQVSRVAGRFFTIWATGEAHWAPTGRIGHQGGSGHPPCQGLKIVKQIWSWSVTSVEITDVYLCAYCMYVCELGWKVYREQNCWKYGMKLMKLMENKKTTVYKNILSCHFKLFL